MDKTKPLLSVCIQTYQHAEYIRQCLDSVLMQKTSFPFEIILGEDESTDGTREICIEYAEKHPDIIRLFLRSRKDVIKINGQPTGRFNLIENIKEAKGKYVALLEGDDYWTNGEKLQKQIDFLLQNIEYSGVFHNTKLEWMNSNNIRGQHYFTDLQICNFSKNKNVYYSEDSFKGAIFHTSSFVFVRDYFPKELPSWFKQIMSGDLGIFSMVSQSGPFKHLDFDGSCYRKHNSGVTVTHGGVGHLLNRIFMLLSLNQFFNKKYSKTIYIEIDILYNTLVKMVKAGSSYTKLILPLLKYKLFFGIGNFKFIYWLLKINFRRKKNKLIQEMKSPIKKILFRFKILK
ncbi:MAG: glycosyltransferase [Bacteroidetes bacterium]|nr:glycosyltransferase [Bacteroidota bacterium]